MEIKWSFPNEYTTLHMYKENFWLVIILSAESNEWNRRSTSAAFRFITKIR